MNVLCSGEDSSLFCQVSGARIRDHLKTSSGLGFFLMTVAFEQEGLQGTEVKLDTILPLGLTLYISLLCCKENAFENFTSVFSLISARG